MNRDIKNLKQIEQLEKAEEIFKNYTERLARRTLKRQQQELASFQNFLLEQDIFVSNLMDTPAAWSTVRCEFIKAFVEYLSKQGFTASSINMRLQTMKTYCRLAAQADMLDPLEYDCIKRLFAVNDNKGATHIGAKKTEPNILNNKNVEWLLHQPDTSEGKMGVLLLLLLLRCGLWPREIAALDRSAFDFEKGTLTFYDYHARQEHTYILDAETRHAAQQYLADAAPSEALFLGNLKDSTGATRITDRAIYNHVRALGAAAEFSTLSPQDCHIYWEQHRNESTEDSSLNRNVQRKIKTSKTARPDVFNRQKFEASLIRQRVPDSLISPIVSDFRILMPLLIEDVGEEEFFARVEKYREVLGLGPQKEWWQRAIKHIVYWAREQVEEYQKTKQ